MVGSRGVRLSSLYTPKIVTLIVDLALLSGLLYFGGLSAGPFIFIACAALIVQTPIWQSKEVTADDDGLHVRGLRREAVIPDDQITNVRQPWWRTRVLHVHLREESPFGFRVVFMPVIGTRAAAELLQRRMTGG